MTRIEDFFSAEGKLLTGLPDALWCRQGVTEDALMPEASKTMDHLSSTVQDHTLHLIFTVVWAPVARLEKRREDLCKLICLY